MRKTFLFTLSAVFLSNLLCSYKSAGTLSLKIYSFTQFRTVESGKNDSGAGHSFVILYNNTDYTYKVGNYDLNAKSSISIGLWKAGVTVGSSGGSSSESSSSSSQAPDHNGVYYGREMYYYNKVENMTNAVNYEIVIDTNTLNKISEKISEVNDTYNLLSYNCANFSTDLWNIATGKSWWSGWFRTPSNVIDDIKNDYSNSYSSDNSLPYSSKFCYYENNAKVEWNMA